MKKKSTVILAGVTMLVATLLVVLWQATGTGTSEAGVGIPEAAAQEAAGQEAGAQQTAATSNADGTGPVAQPIAFPHDVHVQDYQMDCQYCHYSASRSVDAGMPPVGTCMGCHRVVAGSQNPEEIETLRGYAQREEPIPWIRVYKVADHVHFPHLRHVSAGVECQTCHGPVQEMGVVEEVNQPLSMGWCVSCHEERAAARDCTVCHY